MNRFLLVSNFSPVTSSLLSAFTELKAALLWIRIWLQGMLWPVWSSIQATKIFYISANKVFHFLLLLFWLHHTTCGILVSWPGIELKPCAVGCRVITTGPSGKSQIHLYMLVQNFMFLVSVSM